MKRIFCIPIIFGSWVSFSQQTFEIPSMNSYNEFVFPPDINNYPLLFVLHSTDGDPDIKNSNKKEAERQVLNFIQSQKQTRGIDHLLIKHSEINNYDGNLYKYVVNSVGVEVVYSVSPPNSSFVTTGVNTCISFYFHNRQNSKDSRISGIPRCPPQIEYWDLKIEHYAPELFFLDLTRIISNLDKLGIEETFNFELERQIKKRRNAKIGGVAAIGGIMLGFAIGGIISTF